MFHISLLFVAWVFRQVKRFDVQGIDYDYAHAHEQKHIADRTHSFEKLSTRLCPSGVKSRSGPLSPELFIIKYKVTLDTFQF